MQNKTRFAIDFGTTTQEKNLTACCPFCQLYRFSLRSTRKFVTLDGRPPHGSQVRGVSLEPSQNHLSAPRWPPDACIMRRLLRLVRRFLGLPPRRPTPPPQKTPPILEALESRVMP